MADTTPDIRELIRRDQARPDSAAVAHVLVATIFLGVGALIFALAMVAMTFPSFIPLGYGLLRAMSMLAIVMGFGTLSVIGGSYYVLPRLTGARLWNEQLAWAGLVVIATVTAAGIIVVGAGFGDGGEPFAMPWWLDLPLLAGLALPPLVAVQTLRHRFEHRTFVTVPFVVTGLLALPLLYLAGNIPGLAAVPSAVSSLFSAAAHLVVLVFMAVGLLHYAIVKETDRPLAGRQLAQVAYWSLLFGVGWLGVVQLAGGPIPSRLSTIAAVLGLGLPVGMAATTASVTATLSGTWDRSEDGNPVVMAAVAGSVFGLVLAVLASLASFRSTAVHVALTPYWEGIVFGLTMGVLPLLIGSALFQAIPRMSGRRLFSEAQGRRFVTLTLIGAGALTVFLVLAGIVAGYAWAGGAFTGAYVPVGEGWATAFGSARIFLGLGTAGGLVAAWAALTLVSLITSTLTRGKATTQEVLVAREVDS